MFLRFSACFAFVLALSIQSASFCFAQEASQSLVPLPQQVKKLSGETFTLTAQSSIVYGNEKAKRPAMLLADYLRPATGYSLAVINADHAKKGDIFLTTKGSDAKKGTESYTLKVSKGNVTIQAPQAAGLVYGGQTLRQLLPAAIYSKSKVNGVKWTVGGVAIDDQPGFVWRGMMLDVSRYFFDKEFVLKYLDMMAMHKMNVLHWHLIDDAGWRIEIKKYPKLTTIGGFRGKGEKRYGGFYTQEDIREIVQYAKARNIVIVPEVEIPAHTLAAVVAYPYLCCTGKQMVMPTRHSISRELYCAGSEKTWQFLEDVMDEVSDLFPGKFIHVGGDEARYDRWKKCSKCQAKMKQLGLTSEKQLQGWMTQRIEKYLQKKGKQVIGWADILDCGVSNRAGLMVWHRPKRAVDGARRGNPVVMALTGYCYFDVAESKLKGEPPAATWLRPISLQKAYDWHPVPTGLTGNAAKNILGAHGCLWSDQFLHQPKILPDRKEDTGPVKRSELYIEYLTLPRMAALAEVTWTAKPKRNWDDFSGRMERMFVRYSNAEYNYRMPLPAMTVKKSAEGSAVFEGRSLVEGGVVRYTTDGTTPSATSAMMTGPVKVVKASSLKAVTFGPDGQGQSLVFEHVDQSQKYAKYGKKIGQWKAGQVGSGKPKNVVFDATGLINKSGNYVVTFVYTGGTYRLDIDSIKVVQNDQKKVAEDIHHGYTGGSSKKNQYTVSIKGYETGASYKIHAAIYGDLGDDSNGLVFIKRKK